MSGPALRFWGCALVLVLGFFAILPRLLSTEWGNRQLLYFLNGQITGRVEAKHIQLQWLGEQKIEGFLLRDPQGEQVLEVETLSLQASLFTIFQKNPSLGKVEITGVHLLLHQNEAGVTNLQKALGVFPPLSSSLPQTSPLLLSIPNAVLDLFSHPGLFSVSLEASIDQAGETGKLDLHVSIPGIETSDWTSVQETGVSQFLARGSGIIAGHQIPAALFHYLYPFIVNPSLPPLQDIFGKQIAFSLSRPMETSSSWKIFWSSSSWKTEALFVEKEGVLQLQNPAHVQGMLSPDLVSTISSRRLEVESPIDIFLEVAELSIPLSSANTWAAVAELSWKQRLSSMMDEAQGITNLEGTCRLEAPSQTKEVSFFLEGGGWLDQTPLSLHVEFAGKERGNGWINQKFYGSGHAEAQGIPVKWWIDDLPWNEGVGQMTCSFQVNTNTVSLKTSFSSPRIQLEGGQFRLDFSSSDHVVYAKGAVDRLQVWNPHWQNWVIFQETLAESTCTDFSSFEATLHTRFQGWQQSDSSMSLSIFPLLCSCRVGGSFSSWVDANVEVIGEGVQARFCGQLDFSQKMLLTKQGNCTLSVPSDVLESLGRLVLSDPIFQVTASSLELQVFPTRISLTQDWLSHLRLEGKFRVDQLAFKTKNGMQIALAKVEAPWKIESPQDQMLCFIKAKWAGSENDSNAGLAVTLRVDHWLRDLHTAFHEAKFELSTELRSLSFARLSDWLGVTDLTPVLGEALDLDLKTSFDFSHIEPGYWDMHVDSSLFHAKTRLKLDKSLTLYQSNKPTAEIRWTLTPEGYAYLATLRGWTGLPHLAKSVVWDAYLTDLDIPLQEVHQDNIQSKIVGRCETTDWKWDEIGSFGCRAQALFEASTFLQEWQLSADLLPSQDLPQIPLFSASGKLSADTPPYPFNPAVTNIQVHCEAKKLPLSLCKKILLLSPPLFEPLEAFLGETITHATANCALSRGQGNVTTRVDSTLASVNFVGSVEEGGIVLKEPLKISTTLSPQLISWASRQYGSFFHRIDPSSRQITLQIDPQNSHFPLWGGELSQIQVGAGVLQLDPFSLRNPDGALSNFITPFDKGLVSVWCTPIYFTLHDHLLQIQRWDCQLAGKYTLAGWGQVKLQPLRGNLTLGLHPDILQEVFHLSTKKNYLFQIPVKVHGTDVQIHKTKVLARIGALATQLQNDARGKLLGVLLDAALSDHSSLSPPQPTTSPFPWEKR